MGYGGMRSLGSQMIGRLLVLALVMVGVIVPAATPALAVSLPTGAAAADAGYAEACPDGEVPDGGFADVAQSNPHARRIDCAAWRQVVRGVGDGRYAPGGLVTRGQMATFIVSMMQARYEFRWPVPDVFQDTTTTHHRGAINQLARLGIVAGTGPGTYEPDRPVT